MSRAERKALIRRDRPALSLSRQCEILAISRSPFHDTLEGESPANLVLMRRIDELFPKDPFYRSRQMARQLRRDGLCVGFAGGFRRSELVAMDRSDIEQARQGMIVHIGRSKTDHEGIGRKIWVPYGLTNGRPVAALDVWLARSGIADGPVFRRVDRHGTYGRRSSEAISLIIKERVAAVGFDPER